AVAGPLLEAMSATVTQLEQMRCPTIAATAGPAVGPGLALALACDLRVVGPGARYVPGFFRLGGSPDGGVSTMLVRAFGYARALSMSLRDTSVTAEQLVAAGLAECQVADDEVLATARLIAAEVSGKPPAAMPRLRRLMAAAIGNDLGAQLAAESRAAADLWDTNDFRESLAAWIDKRQPQFTGS
ncbi:MAG TPA: enoyl-CoA hydratase-related protein, partial [Ilumatobacteraceae bacterium]